MTNNAPPNSWIDLTPCPFCGATEEAGDLVMSVHEEENEQGDLLTLTSVWCMECSGEGPTTEQGNDEAANLWNRRAPAITPEQKEENQ